MVDYLLFVLVNSCETPKARPCSQLNPNGIEIIQPGVARKELPWVEIESNHNPERDLCKSPIFVPIRIKYFQTFRKIYLLKQPILEKSTFAEVSEGIVSMLQRFKIQPLQKPLQKACFLKAVDVGEINQARPTFCTLEMYFLNRISFSFLPSEAPDCPLDQAVSSSMILAIRFRLYATALSVSSSWFLANPR